MQLMEFYKQHFTQSLLPFWLRAVDHNNGGVYTCYTNTGEALLSKDKFTWSQGRFLWLMAHLAEMCEKGLIEGNLVQYKGYAEKTVEFLKDHAFLPNGNCVFRLSETGEWKEASTGGGFDTSFFADCFVAIGFSEYARVFNSKVVLEDAVTLFRSIQARLITGKVRSEPYPVPAKYRAHSFPMIMLHTADQLAKALAVFRDARFDTIAGECERYLADIMDEFYQPDGRIAEMVTADQEMQGNILARHINPGHAIECMWFVIKAAEALGRQEYVSRALQATRKAFELGWDTRDGGLFRFVDLGGGRPEGKVSGDPFERLILDTWDMKLWWPHSEALYATLLAYSISGEREFLELYSRTHAYTFRVFPQPDPAIGEWIQVRNREGLPAEKVVALPVKDPYHIMRNTMLIIELLHSDQALRNVDGALKSLEVGDRRE